MMRIPPNRILLMGWAAALLLLLLIVVLLLGGIFATPQHTSSSILLRRTAATTTATDPPEQPQIGGGGGDTAPASSASIVGGQPADSGAYPFFAHRERFSACGATLIHPDLLLTAAHCLGTFVVTPSSSNKRNNKVCLGGHQRRDCVDAVERIAVTREYVHADFYFDLTGVPRNDVMLVRLAEPSNATVAAVLGDVDAEGSKVTAIGFGTTAAGTAIPSDQLLEVDLTINNLFLCNLLLLGSVDGATMLCAGGWGVDTCQGDS